MDNIELELRGIRYLINNLTLQIFDLREKLEDIKPSTRPYTLPTPNNSGDDVKFDMFSMSRDRYTRLCDKYGIDIVNRGCSRLDSYIRDKEHQHLLGKERRVKEKMEKCIGNYKKAKENIEEKHNAEYCGFSTLQYFEEYIYSDESNKDTN